MVAYLSHVPQLVSWALAAAARRDAVARRHLALAGLGFAGMTRLARSPRGLWREVLALNAPEVARGPRGAPLRELRRTARRMTGPPVSEEAIAFVLKLGRGLHAHGYPAHRLEAALVRVSHRLGLHGQFFSMPTALLRVVRPESDQRTFQIRVDPGAMDLRTLVALEAVASEVRWTEPSTRPRARAASTPPSRRPAPYPAWVAMFCFAVSSACAARFFGGGLARSPVPAGVGLVVGVLAMLSQRVAALGRVSRRSPPSRRPCSLAWPRAYVGRPCPSTSRPSPASSCWCPASRSPSP